MTVAITTSLFSWSLYVGAAAEREYQIKAAYLYNLAKFIEWPQPSVSNATPAEQEFLICSIDHKNVNSDIEALSGRNTHNNKITVRILNKKDSIPKACKIIFIPSVYNQLKSVLNLNSEEYSGILSVGENDEFIHNNGLIALVLNDNRIQLKINLKTAKQRNFKLSGKLLEIAEIIE